MSGDGRDDDVPVSFTSVEPNFESAADKHGAGRRHFSNFLVTLNTNHSFEDESVEQLTEMARTMTRAAQATFGDSRGLRRFVEFYNVTGPRQLDRVHDIPWNRDTIASVSVRCRTEIGSNRRGKRLHTHLAIKIVHYTYIRLDPQAMKTAMSETLQGMDFPYPIKYCNVRSHGMTPDDYLNWD